MVLYMTMNRISRPVRKRDVIGIGSAFVDYFFDATPAYVEGFGIAIENSKEVTRIEFEKSTKKLSLLAKSPGGSTPNTLAALSHLGINTGYQGVIGQDFDAKYWKKALKNIDLNVSEKGHTSTSACLLTHNRQKRSFLYTLNPTDNDFFTFADMEYLNRCRFLHITQFYLAYKKTFRKLIALVKKIEEPKISFSPGEVYISLGLKALSPLLQKTHVLFFSKYELEILFPDVKKGSQKLLEYGPKIIVCTLGENGALITTENAHFISPAKKVENIVDTTGAGDAFAAGFLFGLIKNKSLEECAKLGNEMGAKSITDFGLHWLKSL